MTKKTANKLEKIKKARQEYYGDPLENHKFLAGMFAPILKEHAKDIAEGKPLPAWVIALLLVLLKGCRMRKKFLQDNYDDMRVYLSFAEEWQKKGL